MGSCLRVAYTQLKEDNLAELILHAHDKKTMECWPHIHATVVLETGVTILCLTDVSILY